MWFLPRKNTADVHAEDHVMWHDQLALMLCFVH
jgi:hypothetical protein